MPPDDDPQDDAMRTLPPFDGMPAEVRGVSGTWAVVARRGSAQALHDASAASVAAPSPVRSVVVNEVVAPAWVLGSAQRPEVLRSGVRAASVAGTGPQVAVRRSGGGLVALAPGAQLWVDLVVPAGDPLFADATRLSVAVGEWWRSAFLLLGLPPSSVRADAAAGRSAGPGAALGRTVCFAGLGRGEVEIGSADGRWSKVVGLSQRRTRSGAVVQCVAPGPADGAAPDALLDALDPDEVGGPQVVDALRAAVPSGPVAVRAPDALLRAFLTALAEV